MARRITFTGGLLGVLMAVLAAQEPPKAPWQMVLKGDHAKQAAALEKQIAEHETADRYAQAIAAAEELLALRQKLQGASHWEATNEGWRVERLKKVMALAPEQRAAWRKAWQDTNADRRRLLRMSQEFFGDEHPETARCLNYLGFSLYSQGKPGEAEPLYQKALALRQRLLGEEHYDTAGSYNNLALNLESQGKYAAATPLLRKALEIWRRVLGEEHSTTALAYFNLASNLRAQGKYAEAESPIRKALELRRKLLGEDDADTASAYLLAAVNLYGQGKHKESTPFFQKALEISRKVRGEEHSDTAEAYNGLAFNLYAQARHAEAAVLFQRALEIRRKLLGDDHRDTAMSFNNLGLNLIAQGKAAEAAAFFQKFLNVNRKQLGEDHPDTATAYNNLSSVLSEQGKLVEAAALILRAIEIQSKVLGEEHPDTIRSYGNLAGNLARRERYEEAAPIRDKVLQLYRKVLGEEHPRTINAYAEVAMGLYKQRKLVDATSLCRRALDVRRKVLGDEHPDTAASYTGLADILTAQGKHAEATAHYQRALAVYRTTLGEEQSLTTRAYTALALNLNAQGKYAETIPLLEAAARTYDAARLVAADRGLDRSIWPSRSAPYIQLATLLAREQRFADAWRALEGDTGRGLLDELSVGARNSAAEQQKARDLHAQIRALQTPILNLLTQAHRDAAKEAELKTLLEARKRIGSELSRLVVQLSKRGLATLAEVQAALPADAALIAWADSWDVSGQVQEHWGCVVRAVGPPAFERLPGTGPDHHWTLEDHTLHDAFRQALARPATSQTEITELSRRLYVQRLAPLEPHLTGVRRLYVVPVELMAGVPVEVLADRYTVSYVASGTQLVQLRKRPASSRAKTLLALGDPVFDDGDKPQATKELPPGGLLITQVVPGSNAERSRLKSGDVLLRYAGEELKTVEQLAELVAAQAAAKSVEAAIWRPGQGTAVRDLGPGRLGVVLAREPAPQAMVDRRKTDQLLASLQRGGEWSELPGTRIELARLEKLFGPTATILADSAASEQSLDAMRPGELARFRYLHFATHGETNDERAFESALILAQDHLPKELPLPGKSTYDGRLTAKEVLTGWKLDADLVTLSACESGLGRYGGGDGFLGFAQAFLLAGSRSVCLSLWKVDDAATALLMSRFYENLLGRRAGLDQPLPKAAALAESKAWLRQLSASDAVKLIGNFSQGVSRGKGQKLGQLLPSVPAAKEPAERDAKPYAHPRYWAAFVLFGDPD